MTYRIISAPCTYTYEIKRSQFIAYACRVEDRGQALFVVNQRRELLPDARHHCWAYIISSAQQPTAMAMSDDGEPSGTAGKPMLNVLQHGEIGDVLVVISRYFGGVKLGAGGLVRAYSHATQQVLNEVKTVMQIPMTLCKIKCEFSQEQFIRHILSKLNADILALQYSDLVSLNANIPNQSVDELLATSQTHQFTVECHQ